MNVNTEKQMYTSALQSYKTFKVFGVKVYKRQTYFLLS